MKFDVLTRPQHYWAFLPLSTQQPPRAPLTGNLLFSLDHPKLHHDPPATSLQAAAIPPLPPNFFGMPQLELIMSIARQLSQVLYVPKF